MPDQRVILFDGVCNLCNSAVKFVLHRDKNSMFKFASLQSAGGKQLLKKAGITDNDSKTFILIENGRAYTRSTAALRVCRHLSGLWPLMEGFRIVPVFLRDWVYNLVSRNRYRWFGKSDTCMVPSPGIEYKFLNEVK